MAVGIQEAPPRAKPNENDPFHRSISEVTRAEPGEDRLVRFTLEQTYEMIRHGIMREGAPIVLLDGLLVRKMTIGAPHTMAANLLLKALQFVDQLGWTARKEDPLVLPDGPRGHPSEPEPDISVVRGTIRDYATRKPHPGDVALIAEVSDSTLREDRQSLPRFAWSNIPAVWIVNLAARNVEVSTNPSGPGDDPRYGSLRTYGASESIPVVLDGVEVGQIAVAGILP